MLERQWTGIDTLPMLRGQAFKVGTSDKAAGCFKYLETNLYISVIIFFYLMYYCVFYLILFYK